MLNMSVNEKRIKNGLKRILKRFPQYKRVDDIDDADLAIIYHVDDNEKFQVAIIDFYIKKYIRNETNEKIKTFYLKHKNQRNRKQLVINDVVRNHFMLEG